MRVLVVSLNPAVDQTITLNGFHPGQVNRADTMHLHPGGKGVNVAGHLAASGVETELVGFIGLENQSLFQQHFDRLGIRASCIGLPGATRTALKLVDLEAQRTTDINLPGLAPQAEHLAALNQLLSALLPGADWLVCTGSLPPGMNADWYAGWIRRAREGGVKTALDSSGQALRLGVLQKPDLIKPNHAELGELLGVDHPDQDLTARAARRLAGAGIGLVAVSLGAQGGLFCTSGDCIHLPAVSIQVRSTAGAGDALLAGLILGRLRGLNLEGCARLGMDYAGAAVARVDPSIPISL